MRTSRGMICRKKLSKTQRLTVLAIFIATLMCFNKYVNVRNEKESSIKQALGNGRVGDLVKPDNDTLIVNGLLSDTIQAKNTFIVVAVTSLPDSLERRNIIRETWALKASDKYGVSVIFFMGKPNSQDDMANLIAEAEQFHDVIVDDFKESYYALSIKTLRVLKYFKLYHPKSKFLVKTDDDVYVNLQNLVHFCYKRYHEFDMIFNEDADNQSFLPPFLYVAGRIHSDRGPHTFNTFSKWYAPANVWATVYETVLNLHKSKSMKSTMSEYPPYAEGNFYVMSDDAVDGILKVCSKVPLYHLEDVYVTGVIATWMLGIDKEDIPFVSSASNMFPEWSYWWYSKWTSPSQELIAFHCDSHVKLMQTIHLDVTSNVK